MYLSISPRKKGTAYLSIQKRYWDVKTKSRTSTTIESLGYLDDLKKEYDDPITHFRAVAKQMTADEETERKISVELDMEEELPEDAPGTKNFGYALPMKIYHELWLDDFFKRKMVCENFEFNTNSIMLLLVISRILSPGSKKNAFENKDRYFERFDFTLDDVYRALSHFAKISAELQQTMYDRVKKKYGSDTSVVYYDVTNYYFEISKPDENRKYGKAKQNRKKPIIQMGLAMDTDGIPLHYKLFPGNKLDKETFRSVIGEVKLNYNTGRIIVVADMGIITGDNIHYLVGNKPDKPLNGYVFSFSVRGGTAVFKKYVLDENDYKDEKGEPVNADTEFKIKSRVIARDINVTMQDGSISKKTVYEKQIVFWNRKYAVKAQAERAEMLEKAAKLIADPKKYTKATSYGAAAYVNNIDYDKETGLVKGEDGKMLTLNTEKIEEDQKYDGYYSIVTSELHMSDNQIIDTYRGLWEIEETFKITKQELSARPVYVSDYDHIDAHFLICFISLTIIRIMQKVTGKQYSAEKIIKCLNKIECMNMKENIYLFGYRSKIAEVLGKAFNINFKRKYMKLIDIKKFLGDVKK